ncbi:MAG: alpha/beta hydrolase-fold protein [Chloroflexota bacterium]
MTMANKEGCVYFLTPSTQTDAPFLEILEASDTVIQVASTHLDQADRADEIWWEARFSFPTDSAPTHSDWQFRLNLGGGHYLKPPDNDFYTTALQTIWLQDHQIFDYQPTVTVSASQVIKISDFTGSLSPRALYIYLPRGYEDHSDRYYPVIYMHDGQNCFESFVGDSFSGSWRADEVADRLISQGQMRETIIVGVSNGQESRNAEYLPPYTILYPSFGVKKRKPKSKKNRMIQKTTRGRAGQTAAYYRYEVAPYIQKTYRALDGREHRATCGSSMGGLFTTYLAWERTEFARNHAALSPSYWITRTPKRTFETIERLRTGEPRDIRLWLDSGTLDAPGRGDDGLAEALAARDALIENGYQLGPDFQHYIAEGAIHHESAWSARLDKVFRFLFPAKE